MSLRTVIQQTETAWLAHRIGKHVKCAKIIVGRYVKAERDEGKE